MILEMILQFLAASVGTISFSLLFSVPREHYPLCGLIGGIGWIITWFCINGLQVGAIAGTFIATVFIVFASRAGSTIRKCPVTLFLIPGIFPLVPGVGIYRTVYYTLMKETERSEYYGRQTVGIAVAIVLGSLFVFEISQKTINLFFLRKK